MIKRFISIEEVKDMKQVKQNVFTPNIAIMGVGGAGANAINNLINMNLTGVKFIVANTDVKSLDSSLSPNKIRLGLEITKGLGAGSKPDIGYQAAEESVDDIRDELKDIDLLFIISGMGGGTGTGASQVIAKTAKELDILTLGFVTKPFIFEGKQRMVFAKEGINELQKYIDSLVVISNQNLFKVINENTSMVEAFRIMDNIIHSGVKAITDLIISNGMVNLDFNDIKSVIKEGGMAMVTSVEISGSDRVNKITDSIINNPLIDENISLFNATNILINITGGVNMTLFEVDKIVNSLREKANKDTYINFGAIFDESMSESIRVAIVATGIDEKNTSYLSSNHITEEQNDNNSMINKTKSSLFNKMGSDRSYDSNVANTVENKISTKQNISNKDNSSLFNMIEERNPNKNIEEEYFEGKNDFSNTEELESEFDNSKNKQKTTKSFFELPPFLRQKK